MKRWKWLFGVLTVAALACGALACGDPPAPTVYEFSLAQTAYAVDTGETFTVPVPEVTPAPGEGTEILWEAKFGSESVSANQAGTGFVAEREGAYTVRYSLSEGDYKPFSITVTSTLRKVATAAPTALAVEGAVLTFEAEAGRTCYLYVNGTKVGEIESGDDISEWIGVGENEIAVRVGESATALESPLSESVTVRRLRAAEISMNGSILTFEAETGASYRLFVSGVDKGLVTSGADLSDQWIAGTNEVYVIAEGEGVFPSAESNVVTRILHAEITDFALNLQTGVIGFAARTGFNYELYLDGTKAMDTADEDDLSDLLDGATAGEHTLSVKIVPSAANCMVFEGRETSNEVRVTKLAPPAITSVADETLTFTAEAEDTVLLFVDGTEIGEAESGMSLLPLYTTDETMRLTLRAEREGFWRSNATAEETIAVPAMYRKLSGSAKVTHEQRFAYTDDATHPTEIYGEKVTGKSGDRVEFADVIDFEGLLFELGYVNQSGAYTIRRLNVIFTDAETNETLTVQFFLNSDVVGAGGVYAGWSFGGTEEPAASGNNILLIDLSDCGNYASPLPRTLSLSKTADGLTFNNPFTHWSSQFLNAPALEDFGAQGVKVAFEFVDADEDSSFILSVVGPSVLSKNASFYFAKTNEYFSGTRIRGTQNGDVYRVGDLDWSGKLLELCYLNHNGNYAIGKMTLRFTDKATSKVLDLVFELTAETVNQDGVNANWTFDGVSGTADVLGIDLSDKGSGLWYGSQVPRVLGIELTADGITFSNGFVDGSWPKQFIDAPELGEFGAQGVTLDVVFDEIVAGKDASLLLKLGAE